MIDAVGKKHRYWCVPLVVSDFFLVESHDTFTLTSKGGLDRMPFVRCSRFLDIVTIFFSLVTCIRVHFRSLSAPAHLHTAFFVRTAMSNSSSPSGLTTMQIRYIMDEPIFGDSFSSGAASNAAMLDIIEVQPLCAGTASRVATSGSPSGFTMEIRDMDVPIFGDTSGSPASDLVEETIFSSSAPVGSVSGVGPCSDSGDVCDQHSILGDVVLPIIEGSDAGPSESQPHFPEPPPTFDPEEVLGGGDYFPLNIINDVAVDAEAASRRTRHSDRVGRSRSPPGPALLAAAAARHGSLGAACWELLVGRPRGEVLERGALANMMDGITYTNALLIARRRVLAEARTGQPFYIGITESPHRRFREHSEGGGQTWERMVVLVQAVSSSTTASLERELLREFGDRTLCHNNSAGGEGASAGSPHFLYMLLGGQNPFRRSR